MAKQFYLTKKGLEKLKKEYEELCAQKQKKLKSAPAEIFHSEDLNPEYITFLEEIEVLEKRIDQLKQILSQAKIIKSPTKGKEIIQPGATIFLEDKKGKLTKFTIVGSLEADPLKRKISIDSPLAQALLGKKKGETVFLPFRKKTPFLIKEISYHLD
jgi:transcription elongation factor GreA